MDICRQRKSSFTISDTEDVQYVEMQDEVPTGTIVINKDGEFLTDINLIKGTLV